MARSPGLWEERKVIEQPRLVAQVRPVPQFQVAPTTDEPVTGILLAGGRSQRMGRDKAWVEMAGRPLVRWVLDALQMATESQVIVAREGGRAVARLEALGLPVVVDHFEARGPLTGIHAGLKASGTDLNVVVACDLPLVSAHLLAYLAGVVGSWHAAVPYVGEGEPPDAPGTVRGQTARDAGLQPLLAAYRRACIAPLERLIASGPVPTTALISVIRARIIHPDAWRTVDPDGRSFFNVNTHEDLITAAQLLTRP